MKQPIQKAPVALCAVALICAWAPVAVQAESLSAQKATLSNRLETCQQNGDLTVEQASALKAERNAIIDKENKLAKRDGGNLNANHEKEISKKLTKLEERVNKLIAAKPNNTASNKGDARPESVTPEDQSNSKDDIRLTSKIRKELMSDKTLSSNAKNIKIVSIKGQVTLRGPVDSASEQEKVVAAAKSCAGSDFVVDKLEVLSR